jgi:hypothetical protein
MIKRHNHKATHTIRGLVVSLLMLVALAPAAPASDHLMLTKVAVMTRPNPGFGSEYVSITNPSAGTVDLSNYYLTDATYPGVHYWELTLGDGSAGGGIQGDFNARFPVGSTLAAGETIVIAFEGSITFNNQFGVLPDFELFEDAYPPDDIPDLVETHPGSIGTGLGNTGNNTPPSSGWLDDQETLVLYRWDGLSDLVQDVDYLTWGADTTLRIDKTGVAVDGLDADAVPSTYLPDTAPGLQSPMTVGTFMEANVRVGDEGTETTSAGNGIEGHDETSENLAVTWSIGVMDPPVSGATRFAAPVITSAALAGGTPTENVDVLIDLTLLSPPANAADEVFVRYRVDEGGWLTVAAYPLGGADWTAIIPGQLQDAVVDWWVEATGEEGGADTWPSAAPIYFESFVVLPPIGYPSRLLISEVCVMGSESEFVEIFNPTDEAVDLTDYYLTDAIYLTGNQGYWRMPEGVLTPETVGGGAYFDFHARFPAGAMLAAGEAVTITIQGSEGFNAAWGLPPDYELFEDDASADGITDMLEIFPGSNWGGPPYEMPPALSNTAEIVVLYNWDGVSELVTDVDMFFWGSSTSARVDKTGYTIGSSTYAPDTPIASQDEFSVTHAVGESYQRLDNDETGEPTTGGNGIWGHDETGEPLNTTWVAATGTPGVHENPTLVITDVVREPTTPQPDEAVKITATIVAEETVTSVDLHYRVDGGLFTAVAMVDNLDNTWSATIPGFPDDTLVEYYVDAVDDQAGAAVWPVGAPGILASYTVQIVGEGLARLLLTEVCIIGSPAEFIEIYNPNDFEVPLDNYYLTDAVYYPDQAYWNLPRGNPTYMTIGGGHYYDFSAKFPADAVLPAHETITITVPGSQSFGDTFPGMTPDYELFEDDVSADGIPDMAEIFTGSINGDTNPSLTNLSETNGEIIALYYWDGVSDLTVDIDIFLWGEGASYSASKAGRVNGSSTYLPEAGYPDPFMATHEHLQSYQRLDFDEGTEVQSGSNGFEGADQTC